MSVLLPAISNEYFCSIITMVFSFSICFTRSKISLFISGYCFIISSLSSCFMEFMFLLRSSICGDQLLDNSMDSVNWCFLLVEHLRLVGEGCFVEENYGSFSQFRLLL